MTDHPLATTIPVMIEKMGPEAALTWWVRWGMEWDGHEGLDYSREAIEHMARGDVDHIIVDVDGANMARAFQWVALFGLEPFVEAERLNAA